MPSYDSIVRAFASLGHDLAVYAVRFGSVLAKIEIEQKYLRKYATEILERIGMHNCHSCRTHIDTESKLGVDGTPVFDDSLLESYRGSTVAHLLLYLICLMRSSRFISICMITESLILMLLCGFYVVFWYFGLWSSIVFLFDFFIFGSWSSKRQYTLSLSSKEAEYRGVSNVMAETSWLQNLL
nr:hypothetical protein [Tanacetum cinerariifolium]